jgi:hypothetical protein
MNRTAIAIVALVITGTLGGTYLYLSSNRYYIIPAAEGMAYQIDRKTGETWLLVGDERIPHNKADLQGAEPELRSFPAVEGAKVVGTGAFDKYGSYFEGELYNGSAWYPREVVITILAINRDGQTRWVHQYKGDFHAEPLTAGYVKISVADAKGASCSWRIDEVRGFPSLPKTSSASLARTTENIGGRGILALLGMLVIAVLLLLGIKRIRLALAQSKLGTKTDSVQNVTPPAKPVEVTPDQVAMPRAVEDGLRERATDFAGTEFAEASKQYQQRAAKYIFDRIRLAARHHFEERKTMSGFKDAEQMRSAAAKFREFTKAA